MPNAGIVWVGNVNHPDLPDILENSIILLDIYHQYRPFSIVRHKLTSGEK